MRDQIAKYMGKLLADRSAAPSAIAFAVHDDDLLREGEPQLAQLAGAVLERVGGAALCAARPSLPFADFLVARAPAAQASLIPPDTETRTFLHEVPFLRAQELGPDPAGQIATLLSRRRGVVVEGLGIFACGGLTVEQAYVNYSSVFHATFVGYLWELLKHGYRLASEAPAVADFRKSWLRPVNGEGLAFRSGRLEDRAEILAELSRVGRYTVERWLVDSFFGNISYRSADTIYISQTAASLDELSGCVDPVPFANDSSCGLTASSELAAHRRIYETSDAVCVLHGHPKFPVIMSMLCEEHGCSITDCWRDCPRVRSLGGTPVVAGEIGAGGLAKRVPPVIAGPGRAIVYGHGVFTIGRQGFEEAFRALAEVEAWCREEYFRRLDGLSKRA